MPHVTRAEARVLAEAVHRRAGYLWRLCSRMERTGGLPSRSSPASGKPAPAAVWQT